MKLTITPILIILPLVALLLHGARGLLAIDMPATTVVAFAGYAAALLGAVVALDLSLDGHLIIRRIVAWRR